MPPAVPESESDSASDGLSSFWIWSNPIRERISFAAFFAALPAFFVESAMLSADWEASSIPAPASAAAAPVDAIWLVPDDLLPVISSVKLLNAFARVANFPIRVFTALMMGVNKLISPCPIVAFRESNCSFRMRT